MIKPIVILLIFLAALQIICGCGEPVAVKIRASLNGPVKEYAVKNHQDIKSIVIDSISYTLEDSTVYFHHLLSLLEKRSESYSRMSKLRTNLAQSHMNSFLSGDKNNLQNKNKDDLDRSLEALKINEREWNAVNDSMDLMLQGIHSADTSVKAFYYVNYYLKNSTPGKGNLPFYTGHAILNVNDFKVVFSGF